MRSALLFTDGRHHQLRDRSISVPRYGLDVGPKFLRMTVSYPDIDSSLATRQLKLSPASNTDSKTTSDELTQP